MDLARPLICFGARNYDPALGRFLTADPIGLNGGDTNLYMYVKNNPVNYYDPSGLLLEQIFSDGGDAHKVEAVMANEFLASIKGQSLQNIVTQANPNISESARAGPKLRHVIDPANPSNIIDMRHFMVIGQYGEAVGLGVEILQIFKDPQSAFQGQDFYSNTLGKEFFQTYNPNKDLTQQLNTFFQKRGQKCP